MVALFLLHTNGDTIGAGSCGRKLRSEDERTRVVDTLDLLREFADVDGLTRELRQQGTHGPFAHAVYALDDDGADAYVHILHVQGFCVLLCLLTNVAAHALDLARCAAAVAVRRYCPCGPCCQQCAARE